MAASAAESEETVLVADVGGTNSRFAVACCAGAQSWPRLEHHRAYTNDGMSDFTAQLARYLEGLPGERPGQACLAVAGPILGGPIMGASARLTNRAWVIDGPALAARFGLRQVSLLNDFAALAHALAALPAGASVVLQAGAVNASGPFAVLGPGTGLGAAQVLQPGAGQQVLATEAGHADFAAVTEADWALRQRLAAAGAPVTAETVLRGDGLACLYEVLGGAAVTTATVCARLHEDDRADAAVAWYLRLLGRFAGNLAVTTGATGGVYLAGGVLPRLAGFLPGSDFLAGFNDRGPLAAYAEAMPVRLVIDPQAALGGAALAAVHGSAAGAAT